MKKIRIISVVILFTFTGCSFSSEPLTPEQAKQKQAEGMEQLKQQKIEILSKINLNDGIDEKEAEILATHYFSTFISGCGTPLKPVDMGDHWEIELLVGIAARKMDKNLIINKKTGRMSLDLTGMPVLNNPVEDLINSNSRAPVRTTAPEWTNSSTNKK